MNSTKILETTCEYFDVKIDDVRSKSRKREFTTPRHVAMYLSKLLTKESLSFIGYNIARRDHASVMHAVRTVKNLIQYDAFLREDVDKLIDILKPNKACYISGKISGLNINIARYNFKIAEEEVLSLGFLPVNPFKIHSISDKKDWTTYMIGDIHELFKCQAIYMLQDWEQSNGARIEHTIAKELGLKIIYK